MERTKPTTVWIDGKEVGTNSNISTAQQYELSSYLSPGSHDIAIRKAIDLVADKAKQVAKKATKKSTAKKSTKEDEKKADK